MRQEHRLSMYSVNNPKQLLVRHVPNSVSNDVQLLLYFNNNINIYLKFSVDQMSLIDCSTIL